MLTKSPPRFLTPNALHTLHRLHTLPKTVRVYVVGLFEVVSIFMWRILSVFTGWNSKNKRDGSTRLNLSQTAPTQTDYTLGNQIVIITGAERGLGFELALQLSHRSIKLILASPDHGNGKEWEPPSIAALKRNSTAQIEWFPLDLSQFDSIQTFAKRLHQYSGHVIHIISTSGLFVGMLIAPR